MKKITRSHKPLILITNDDGIQAKGIREVADFLKPLGDILIVAAFACVDRKRQAGLIGKVKQ